MSPLEKIQVYVKKPQLAILFVVLIALLSVYIVKNLESSTDPSQEVIQKSLNRSDFTVERILNNNDGWVLVAIKPTSQENLGNDAFAIVHEEGDSATLKLGPGTYFDKFSMTSAGIPKDMQDEIQTYFSKKRK